MRTEVKVVILSMALLLSFSIAVIPPFLHAQTVTNQKLNSLIKKLQDPDKEVRVQAVEDLGKLGDKIAVPPLIEALKDPDKDVRSAAAGTLGGQYDKTAAPPLIEALKDPDKGVRSAAARALGRLGDKAAVPSLINALKDPDEDVRYEAAWALGRMGGKAAVPPLIVVLKNDTVRKTRCQASMALRNLGYETPADLLWVCERGEAPSPPPPPPLYPKGGEKIVAFWNTWFENRDVKTRVEVLEKDTTYSFVLDISKYAYFGDSSAEADLSMKGWIEKALGQGETTIRFTIRPILYGDILRFTEKQQTWEKLEVKINKLIKLDKDVEDINEKKKDKLSSGEIKVRDFAQEVQAGEVRFDLLAERSGDATIFITIWDDTGKIPLDHMSVSVQVIDATTPVDRRRPVSVTFPLKAGHQTLLNISSDFSTAGPLIADAAFYIFEKSPNKKSLVFFAAKKDAATPGGPEEVSVYEWETESLISEYIEKSDQLIVQVRNARKQAVSIIENEWKYSYQLAAEGLRKKIFGGRNKRDREQAADAEKVFRDLVQKKDQKSIIFVRMRNEDGDPVYLPLGILAASSSSRFLNKRIILIQPLPREHYPAGVHPVGPWTFNIPKELSELSKIGNNALNQLGEDPPYRRDISTVKAYFEATEPVSDSSGPEGVLLLAHQAGGNLWFTNQAIGIVSEDIKRPFPAGSVAILSACSTASSEGNNQAILEKLNANGIDAMIISPFPVHAEYGAMLAINFVKAIEEAKDKKEALSLAELLSTATAQTSSYFSKERSMHFEDMDLEFLIAGDYRILIAPKP